MHACIYRYTLSIDQQEARTRTSFKLTHKGPVWYSVSCFFCQTLISKTASWVKLFFPFSHKDISWMKLEKSSLLQLLPHFSLSTMHEVVGEAILPNSSASSRKSLIKLFSKKNSFTSEVEVCQTSPKTATSKLNRLRIALN